MIGIAVGAAYAILASGLVVTYTTSGIFNFAHGAVAMLAAFTYWDLQQHHFPTWLGLVLVVVVGAPLLGAAVERLFMRRLHGASTERPIMVTLGLLVVMLGIGTLLWNIATSWTMAPLIAGTFRIFGVNLQWQNAVLVVAAVVVAVVLRLLLYRTRLGTGLRAVVDDPELVSMAGVSPARMSRAGWMLGFFLAGLAGVLVAPTLTSTFTVITMTLLVVNGYAAAVVGRLTSIPWTYVGAGALGLAVTYFQQYAAPHLSTGLGGDLTAALPMIFLFVALVALPSVRLRAVGRLATVRVPRVAGGMGVAGGGSGAGRRRRRVRGGDGHHIPHPRIEHRRPHRRSGAGLRGGGALTGPAGGLRRAGLPVPARLHGHRRLLHGEGGRRRVAPGRGRGGGGLRRRGRPGRPAGHPPARAVSGPGHLRLRRGGADRLLLGPAGLRGLGHPRRAAVDRWVVDQQRPGRGDHVGGGVRPRRLGGVGDPSQQARPPIGGPQRLPGRLRHRRPQPDRDQGRDLRPGGRSGRPRGRGRGRPCSSRSQATRSQSSTGSPSCSSS